MIFDCTWTWDALTPPPPEQPEKPEASAPLIEQPDYMRSLPRLMAGLIDSFRDEPATYRRLAAIVKAWRDGESVIFVPPPELAT